MPENKCKENKDSIFWCRTRSIRPSFFEAKVGEPYSSGVRKSKGELVCKEVLEEYYNKKFDCY